MESHLVEKFADADFQAHGKFFDVPEADVAVAAFDAADAGAVERAGIGQFLR